MSYNYKIKETNADPKNVVIEKSGITADFTINQMESEQESLRKYIKQWEAQVQLEETKLDNIEKHHPFILDMSERDLFTAHMYQEAKAIVKVLGDKLPDFKKQLAESEAEVSHIMTELGLATESTQVKGEIPTSVPTNPDDYA